MINLFSNKKFLAYGTFSGTIIGVGFLTLPYIASRTGILVMLVYLAILAFLIALIHYFFSEVSIESSDFLRFPGYVKKYLGQKMFVLASIISVIGIIGTMLVYLIIGGEFLSHLFSSISSSSSSSNPFAILLFFSFGSFFIYCGLKSISKIEIIDLILFFLSLIIIFFYAKNKIDLNNLVLINHWQTGIGNWFLPYGPILYSLWGTSVIPELKELLKSQKTVFAKIIFSTIFSIALLYFLFILLVVSITGQNTSSNAIIGLKNMFGDGMINFLYLFGSFVTFSSFIVFGLVLRKIFECDFKIKKIFSWFIVCFCPLLLFLFGVNQFLPLISFMGGVILGIDGILILLMYKKIRPEKKFFIYPFILIFLIGIIYEIKYFL